MMYTCEEHDLVGSGGTRQVSLEDAKAMIAARKKKAAAAKGETEKVKVGTGTPLGRAFKKFLT